MPRVRALGSREAVFDRFETAHGDPMNSDQVLMLIDSEDRITDVDRTWDHLRRRDGWSRPEGATDDQVLFMTTCMETWIVADRDALREKFGRNLNENQLLALIDLENRSRDDVYQRIRRATSNGYSKGRISFELVESLNPDTLEQHLPSFRRARRILDEKLGN